jgi:hypothetical protein
MSGPHRASRRRGAAVGGLLAITVGLTVVVTAPAAGAAEPVLTSGQTAGSGNISLLKNLPKTGAFTGEGSYNSDLAFQGDHAFAGNYEGFTVYDIKNPRKTREVTQVFCPGSQNDISVHGNLLFLSVDSRRTAYTPGTLAPVPNGAHDSCDTRSLSTAASNPNAAADRAALTSGDYWEGIRIFDISNPAAPQYVKSVRTDCGSHTHTLVPSGSDVFVYVSSYDVAAGVARCDNAAGEFAHDIISIIKVPGGDASQAAVVATPRLFNPGTTAGRSPTTNFPYSNTRGCHDITAYPEKGVAAGACMGEGVLMDISDPADPKITQTVTDKENFAFWHSATFNDAASTVMFTDELGGGGGATCGPPNRNYPHLDETKGANAYYSIAGDGSMTRQGYFKIPREQSINENCVAHNGSLIPAKGKDVMVQAWYQGGISVVDFTDPANPVELGWWDRGPLSDERLVLGGSWSAYYYNGYIFSNDIQKGFDVFEMRDPRVANGRSGKFPTDYNPQSQPSLDSKKG